MQPVAPGWQVHSNYLWSDTRVGGLRQRSAAGSAIEIEVVIGACRQVVQRCFQGGVCVERDFIPVIWVALTQGRFDHSPIGQRTEGCTQGIIRLVALADAGSGAGGRCGLVGV